MAALKAVLFDLNDTLIFQDPELVKQVNEKTVALLEKSNAKIDGEWIIKLKRKCHYERSTGAISDKEFWEVALAEIGVSDPKIAKKIAAIWASGQGKTFADAQQAIDFLRQNGLKIGIVANSGKRNEEDVKKISGIDAVAFSHKLKVRKPHKRMYLAACKKLGVSPEECIFVSDEIWEDLWGAKRLGMRTALINRYEQARLITPDFESDNLLDLAKRIVGI